MKIEVPRSLFMHKTSNGYFVRQGSRKTEIPTEQLNRLLQARSQAGIIRFDEQPVPGTDKSTLRKDLFTRFLRNVETDEQENTQLLKRRLLVEDNGNCRASVAGLLMCSDQSREHLYNSFISAVCYRGPHKDANYQLARISQALWISKFWMLADSSKSIIKYPRAKRWGEWNGRSTA